MRIILVYVAGFAGGLTGYLSACWLRLWLRPGVLYRNDMRPARRDVDDL